MLQKSKSSQCKEFRIYFLLNLTQCKQRIRRPATYTIQAHTDSVSSRKASAIHLTLSVLNGQPFAEDSRKYTVSARLRAQDEHKNT